MLLFSQHTTLLSAKQEKTTIHFIMIDKETALQTKT